PQGAWGVEGAAVQHSAGHLGRLLFGLGLGLLIGGAAAVFIAARGGGGSPATVERPPSVRFTLQHPAEFGTARMEMPALSRDGRLLAYVASGPQIRCIFIHDFTTGETRRVPETEGSS